jgi:alkylation response protein AidB-like acyl-CoA dehydrogenase
VKQLEAGVRDAPERFGADQVATLERAFVQSEMLRLHVRRRLSERLDGITHGPNGSIDKLLMTETEQAVGHAGLAVGGASTLLDADDTWLKVYLYSRAQSVMGGTAQIQKNIIATRILGLPPS